MNYCNKCMSEFEGKAEAKTGFCSGCVDAIARGKVQTKKLEAKAKKNKKPSK